MDICSIVEFRQALTKPQDHFLTLANIEADLATLCRSRHFAECRACIDGRNAMIYAPISPTAISLAHNAISALRNINSAFATKITLHACELRRNNGTTCSILVEWPPYGTPLTEALFMTSCKRLLSELDDLSKSLRNNNISHNNIKPENLIVDNRGHWHLIRQYYSTPTLSGDDSGIEGLRQLISNNGLADIDNNTLCESMAKYTTRNRLIEHRRKIEQNGLVGFADEDDNIVVDCQYLSATNFIEHRSVVTLMDHRVGVIDIDGNAIIEAKYDAIKYDVESGESWAFLGDKAAKFDYLGKQLGEWQDIDELDIEI